MVASGVPADTVKVITVPDHVAVTDADVETFTGYTAIIWPTPTSYVLVSARAVNATYRSF
jgi:hypothetical protein